jgi:deoxyribodipyrimidine photo-lyase
VTTPPLRTLLWFRERDLRLADHPALHEALAGGEVVPAFFLPELEATNAHRFLVDSLAALAGAVARLGSRLLIVRGRAEDELPARAARWRVDRVVAQRAAWPWMRARDARLAAALRVPLRLCGGETLHEPGTLRTGGGGPFRVFTPFARAFARGGGVDAPQPAPRRLPPLPAGVRPEAAPLPRLATPSRILAGGEAAARQRLRRFVAKAARYGQDRDRLDRDGTSRLSADLRAGTISPRAAWHAARESIAFTNELVWREFTHATVWEAPEVLDGPAQPAWRGFPWRRDAAGWRAWVEGATGYPVVDAAARQLREEGFVHNRARMIAAGFLCKHLLVDYRRGEAHYLHWLTDGDPAQNNAGWQWSAGCGLSAPPYFRVFNPVVQGERFDPDGAYVRRWLPELARLPAPHIHAPWRAPDDVLRDAGVTLGRTYPRPIVDHEMARARFLATAREHLRG